jgi:hypothetical protein
LFTCASNPAEGQPSGWNFVWKVDPAVGLREGHDLGLEVEVLEVVFGDRAGVERVPALAVHDDRAVLDLEAVGVLVDAPAVERLAVEEAVKPLGIRLGLGVGGVGGHQHREQGEGAQSGQGKSSRHGRSSG